MPKRKLGSIAIIAILLVSASAIGVVVRASSTGTRAATANSSTSPPKENITGYDNWFYGQRASKGQIQAGAYANGWKQYESLSAATSSAAASYSSLPPQTGGTWSSLGPSEVDSCIGTGTPCSGRVTAIAFDPNHKGTIYVGGAQGGLWKTTNNGSSWTPLTDGQASLATGSIAIDSSGNIYVGTGEGSLSCDSYYGAGILKSTDGGSTWTLLGNSVFAGSTITKLVINSSNPSIIWAATTNGFTASSTESCQFANHGTLGIYESKDGGSSWTIKLSADPVTDLIIDPSSPQVLFAGVQFSGVWESTNGGSTWSGPLSGAVAGTGNAHASYIERVSLGVTTQPGLTIFALLDGGGGSAIGYNEALLYETTNLGSTWTNLTSGLPASEENSGYNFCWPQCWYDMYVAPDPTSSSIIYLGGLGEYVSTSGGSTWTDLSGSYDLYVHTDQHALAFAPYNHNVVMIGNDGGVWWETVGASACALSASTCWKDVNPGLGLTQFQFIAGDPSNANVVFGGTQDNGSPEKTGSSTAWSEIIGGDGGWVAFDPTTTTTLFHAFYGISPQISTDGGSSWTNILSGLNTGDYSQFYIPMAIDDSNPNVLYLGTINLYKTTNQGSSWTYTGLVSNAYTLTAIAVAQSNDNYVYVGDSGGDLFVSANAASSFTKMTLGGAPEFITMIAVNPTNPQDVAATVSGFGASHVYYSTNAGESWTDISYNLPDLPANAVIFDPTGTNIIVGMDVGVYVLAVGSTQWYTVGTGLPNVSVFDLALTANGNLMAATHGRGVWMLSSALPIVSPSGPSGLVGYWPLDEGSGTSAYDLSGNGNTGTLANSPTWENGVNCKFGGCLSFSGSSPQYVSAPTASLPTGQGSVSGSAWINQASTTGTQIVWVYGGTSTASRVGLYINSGQVCFTGYADNFCAGPTLTAGQWHHVAFSLTGGSSTVYLYVDGTQYTGTISPITITSGSKLYVAIDNTGQTTCASNSCFSGRIDDVRIYNSALSANEINALYVQGLEAASWNPQQGLVGYWSLNECQGGSAYDYSGSSNTMTLVNSPTWGAGKFGCGLSLASANGQYSMSSTSMGLPTGSGPFTMSVWVKTMTAGSSSFTPVIFQFGTATTYQAAHIWVDSNNHVSVGFYADNFATSVSINNGNWHNVVFVYNGGNAVTVYIDGAQYTGSISHTGSVTPGSVWLGNDGAGDYFNGQLDDARVYNFALTAAQVLQLYQYVPNA